MNTRESIMNMVVFYMFKIFDFNNYLNLLNVTKLNNEKLLCFMMSNNYTLNFVLGRKPNKMYIQNA